MLPASFVAVAVSIVPVAARRGVEFEGGVARGVGDDRSGAELVPAFTEAGGIDFPIGIEVEGKARGRRARQRAPHRRACTRCGSSVEDRVVLQIVVALVEIARVVVDE